jgi:DNA invertase Pin-like site-specific DNA recombinase
LVKINANKAGANPAFLLKGVDIVNYSYERVSTLHQDERRQEISLEHLKIDRRYIDKVSGKNADRLELKQLLNDVKSGDSVIVESISRFARNTRDFLELIEELNGKQVKFVSVKENIDTSTPTGKFMLTVFAAMAQLEREVIVERIREGLENAKRHGTKKGNPIGRPPATLPDNFEKYYTQWQQGKITKVEFGKLLGCGRKTVYRWIEIYEKRAG